MDELQRQAYLSGLGIDTYMPRWRLPLAPEPVACILPSYATQEFSVPDSQTVVGSKNLGVKTSSESKAESTVAPSSLANVIGSLAELKRKPATPVVVTDIKADEAVPPFSLSIWRPHSELLVVDSRNTKLALPTELLLSNILRAVWGPDVLPGREEIFHWPFIENTAIAHSKNDVRSALQVWLEVELERRPVKYVWAFGVDAVQYFIPNDISIADDLWRYLPLPAGSAQVVVLPSLVNILQQPDLKKSVWHCLTRFK